MDTIQRDSINFILKIDFKTLKNYFSKIKLQLQTYFNYFSINCLIDIKNVKSILYIGLLYFIII